MKTKAVLAIVALSYAPLGVAGNKVEYPNVKVAEFVIEKLDVTSLPSTLRPKKEKARRHLQITDSRCRQWTKPKPSSRRRVE